MKAQYPLQQIVRIKQRRLEEAEKVLKETKEALTKEEKKQQELEDERDTTASHHSDKIEQLRAKLDEGTTTDKIETMRGYIKIVAEELKQKESNVQKQLEVVKQAQARVEEARKDMIQKQHDVEKLETHRKEWAKEMKGLAEHAEGLETDELGTAMHTLKKHKP